MPVRRTWRSVLPFDVEILVTGAALHRIDPLPARTTPDIHGVPMAIISLPWKVSLRVAVHTAWMVEHLYDRFESGGSAGVITRRGPVNVFAICLCLTPGCGHNAEERQSENCRDTSDPHAASR